MGDWVGMDISCEVFIKVFEMYFGCVEIVILVVCIIFFFRYVYGVDLVDEFWIVVNVLY